MKILFELTNCDSHVAMYEPILKVLEKKCPLCEIHILSLCEVMGLYTNHNKLTSITQNIIQPYKTHLNVQRGKRNVTRKVNTILSFIRGPWVKREVGKHMHRLVHSLQPDIIIFPNDRITPHIHLIKAAKERGIPTILIQESIRKEHKYKLSKARYVKLLLKRHIFGVEGGLLYHGQGGCDRIAAWGETSLEYFKMVGVPEEKVVLTGNPRIESITKIDWEIKGQELKQRYSIPESASVIAFTTNPVDSMGIITSDQLLESVSMVVNAVASLEDIFLFLKPHRFEDMEKYRRVVAGSPAQDRIIAEKNIELYPLLSISDACLIFNSTTALEASALGTSVAVVNPFQVDMGIDFVENGLAVEINNREQLISFLQGYRNGEYSVATDAIQKYLAIIDGSADKITTEIVKLANEERR